MAAYPPLPTVQNASVETSRAKKGSTPRFAKQSQGGEELRNAMKNKMKSKFPPAKRK